jgi:hypothetical protein
MFKTHQNKLSTLNQQMSLEFYGGMSLFGDLTQLSKYPLGTKFRKISLEIQTPLQNKRA